MGIIFLLLILFPFLLFFLLLFFASGLLLFVKSEGLRPPWWDWGMDKSVADPIQADAKPEIQTQIEIAAPRALESKTQAKPTQPRW